MLQYSNNNIIIIVTNVITAYIGQQRLLSACVSMRTESQKFCKV